MKPTPRNGARLTVLAAPPRVSIWPKAEQLLEVLEARASDERDPARKRALQNLAGAAREIGVPVIAEILATAAKRTIGMQ